MLFAFGCAHSPGSSAGDAPHAGQSELKIVLASADAVRAQTSSSSEGVDSKRAGIYEDYDDSDEYDDYYDEGQDEGARIADPIEPFNRAMYHFNDKMYFWLLKPVAQGYNFVVPEPARVSVRNFFSNLRSPARFVSCLLQADFGGAATEAGRFAVNTLWGIGGLMDPSSGKELNLHRQDTDLGQTLGFYGVGHGFYIVWPFFGPSSPRDSVTMVGDIFLYPGSYLEPFYFSLGLRAYEEVNSTSLRIGDYEALKDAAIDPYVAIRDVYAQYRLNKVEERRKKFEKFWGVGENTGPQQENEVEI